MVVASFLRALARISRTWTRFLQVRLIRLAQSLGLLSIMGAPASGAAGTAVLTQLSAGRVVLGLYVLWCLLFDRQRPYRGGRPSRALRTSSIWNLFRNYFPVTTVIQGELAKAQARTKRPFMFAVHPHGIWSAGAFTNLMGLHPKLLQELPDLDLRIVTLSLNFMVPIWRDFAMAIGLVDSSKESICYLLQHGTSVAVVVGGAREALDSRPHANDITLRTRLGFIRLAMQNNVQIVPVYTFGENDIYKQVIPNPPGSTVRRVQEWAMEHTGFSIPLVRGTWRSLLPGLMPFRAPLTTVFGEPITLPHIADPSFSEVLEGNRIYSMALRQLFEENAPKYIKDYQPEKDGLQIVDNFSSRDLSKELHRSKL